MKCINAYKEPETHVKCLSINLYILILISFFQIPLLVKLFDKLYSLTNLLVVQPENLKQVCSEEQLVRACMRACTRALFSVCVWAYMLYLFALYLSRVM